MADSDSLRHFALGPYGNPTPGACVRGVHRATAHVHKVQMGAATIPSSSA